MKSLIFKEENKFSTKATVILTGVCILVSIFAVVGIVQAANPGDYCYSSADCGLNMDCFYSTCLAKIYTSCDNDVDCAGDATNLMGCFNKGDGNKCYGRHGYLCGDFREDPVCAPDFHCDISIPGYHYCEGNHTEYCGDGIKNGNEQCDGTDGVLPGYICTAECVLKSIQNPILVITKSVDKTFASPGDEIVYTLNYQNTGNTTATNVVVRDPFINLNQNYLTFISASPSPSSGTDIWNIGTLNAGASGIIAIRARISNAVPNGTIEIKNRGNIISNETSLTYSNYVSTWVSGEEEQDDPELTITKTVRNISSGYGFSSSVNAEPDDEIEFTLEIDSIGNDTAENVRVWDNLPSRLSYISGSTRVDGSYRSDGITTGGIYIGDLDPGDTKIVKFRARIGSENEFYSGTTTLTNYGYTSANNINYIYDTANINVRKEQNGTPGLRIDKLVRNITSGSGFNDTINAMPGDELEFSIRVSSTGSEDVENVRVWDSLPSELNYISGSTTIDGSYRSDGITSGGIYIGSISIGQTRDVRFRVRISSSIAGVSGTTTINVGTQNIQTSSAVSISKLGRNVSQSQSDWSSSFSASYGDQIEFSIQVTNNTGSNLSNVIIKETLPSTISLVVNSTTIDGAYWGGDITGAGLNLGTLTSNQTRTIKFMATVVGGISGGSSSVTLTNTAYASGNDVYQVYDQATAVITGSTGQVLGATTVVTGVNYAIFGLLAIISLVIAFVFYCRIREEKVLNYLNSNNGNKILKFLIKIYFRLKYVFKVATLRFKQVYL